MFRIMILRISFYILALEVKNPPANAGDGSIPGLGRKIPWRTKGNPLQYSYLDIPMDRGAWQATVLGLQSVVYN